ncbi:MAG: ABC transporter ATP-binding protein [bacterium]|jgi:phospholipid/cholesterol/gamma-HCH transport system ATP-binding protein|nr:ABC transporter ATP-binding protein [candidate division KSB1 bacterium]MDH7561245.1 ABC transporter ATP-binding protein [bacterium]
MAKVAIQVCDLVARYDSRVILDHINLEVRKGETMVIVGRSGCGKSTLLRHMVGLDQPASGHVFIDGIDITSADDKARNELLRKMGVLFQSGALFNSMSIGDNVALPLREHTRLEESTIRIMTRMKLDAVGLAGFEHFWPAQLSGGMKKRAALARAIAMDPEYLFCDEPSAGLDPVVAMGIDKLLLRLKRAFKMTMVVVTHELASIFTIADRIAMIDGGRIIAVGTPDELRASTHRRVQQFLNREADEEELDPKAYFRALTQEPGD